MFLQKFLLKALSYKLVLVTVIGQFTAKTTNSEKAIYFLSLMSCSINKLKSRKFFTCKNFVFRFYVEKQNCAPVNGGGGGGGGRGGGRGGVCV